MYLKMEIDNVVYLQLPQATQVMRNYGGMLLFAMLAADEAVVVEQPWLRVMEHFPPAMFRHRFGT